MKPLLYAITLLVAFLGGDLQAEIYADVETSMGNFTIQLKYEDAPQTVANFIRLAEGTCNWVDFATGQVKREPYYNGVTFHRVISGFMNQTGSRKGDGTDSPGYNFKDDFGGGEHAGAYVVSMANSGPNTNGAQFFITVDATPQLDDVHNVFGNVILYDAPDDGSNETNVGQQVCNAINSVAVGAKSKPTVDVVIRTITIRREGIAANDFDEHGQGVPEVVTPVVDITHTGSQVELEVAQSSSSQTRYSYSTDLVNWQAESAIYRDNNDVSLTEIDVSSLANGKDKLFFTSSQVNYDISQTLWPRLLTGKTLSIMTRFGPMVFAFTSETGGSLVYNGSPAGSFAAIRGEDDWLGARMYIQTGLVSGPNPVHLRLRFGSDQVFPAYFAGRHGGGIIYYGSGQEEEPTSGTMTLTRE